MTGRAWKPGDVARMTITRRTDPDDKTEYIAFYGGLHSGGWVGVTDGECTGALTNATDRFIIDARPLVVLDPEDDEQVRKLADAFCTERWDHSTGSDECDPLTFASMQAALRSFVAPPKPEEPGLGGMVETRDGDEWAHVNVPKAPWMCGNRNRWAFYDDLDVVRVIVPGVQP